MDIDLDDLDTPSRAPPTKPMKFAPKNSKFNLVAKPKSEPDTSESNPVAVSSKSEIEQPLLTVPTAHDADGSVKKDIDATDMEIDNDREDEVVREIDVFYASPPDANSKLYVLQYPLRPCWRPYELEDRCEVIRVKPETAEMEIEMSVQSESENFDTLVDDDKAMRKQVLSTAWRPPVANGRIVGILIHNKLYLSPVHAVVQLRPSMQHLKHQSTPHDEETIKIERSTKQVKKQGKLPGVGAVIEQNTNMKEEWIPLKYHGETSLLSHQYIQNMVAEQDSQIQFSMSLSDYLDSLCPATSGKFGPKRSSRSELLKLSLEERFKRHLLEGPSANQFSALKHIAPDASDEDILKVVKEHAVLIQGLWVAKTKLKCQTGVPRDLLLRDYAMLQFSKSIIFHESQLPKKSVHIEHMKVILDEFATKRDSFRDWKFRESPDESFIKKYPHIVEEQKKIWENAEVQKRFVDRRPFALKSSNIAKRSTDIPDQEVLSSTLQKLFQVYKVCSINQIRQRLRSMAISENTQRKGSQEVKAAAAAADAHPEELEKILNQVAFNIHGSFVLRSSSDHPQYDELRNLVISLFQAEGPGGKLKKANIFAAAKVRLKRELNGIEYQKVLSELCISQNSGWVLKCGDTPI